jgi:CRISPR-associated protein Cas2
MKKYDREPRSMLLISYDISDDKLRTHFSKFLSKFGHRLQYSVFEIRNSPRVLENIATHIEGKFARKFSQTDSVYLFQMSKQCKVTKYGYAADDDKDLVLV